MFCSVAGSAAARKLEICVSAPAARWTQAVAGSSGEYLHILARLRPLICSPTCIVQASRRGATARAPEFLPASAGESLAVQRRTWENISSLRKNPRHIGQRTTASACAIGSALSPAASLPPVLLGPGCALLGPDCELLLGPGCPLLLGPGCSLLLGPGCSLLLGPGCSLLLGRGCSLLLGRGCPPLVSRMFASAVNDATPSRPARDCSDPRHLSRWSLSSM